jgi:ribosomal-protein-alanine N-acetyltransferase
MDLQILNSQRLRLEPLLVTHSESLFELFQDPALYTWIMREPPNSLADFRAGIEFLEARLSRDQSEYWLNWVAVNRTTGQTVGKIEISLNRETREAYLAYTTFQNFWRNGYAAEGCASVIEHVFQEWGASKIIIEMDVRNEASVRLAETLGGVRVAFNPRVQLLKGEWSDEYRYEIQRPMK